MALFEKKVEEGEEAKKMAQGQKKETEEREKRNFIRSAYRERKPEEIVEEISVKILQDRINRKEKVSDFKKRLGLTEQEFNDLADYKYNPPILKLAELAKKLDLELSVNLYKNDFPKFTNQELISKDK